MFKRERSSFFWPFILFVYPFAVAISYATASALKTGSSSSNPAEFLALTYCVTEADKTRPRWILPMLAVAVPLFSIRAMMEVHLNRWVGEGIWPILICVLYAWQKPAQIQAVGPSNRVEVDFRP